MSNLFKHKISNQTIAVYGMYTALFLIIGLVPYIGFIKFGPISATIMPIPVIIVTIHKRYIGAVFGCFMFGLTSIIAASYIDPITLSFLGWGKSIIIFFIGRLLIIIPLVLTIFISTKIRINKMVFGYVIGAIVTIFNTLIIFSLMSLLTDSTTFITLFVTYSSNIIFEWIAIPIISSLIVGMAFYLWKNDQNSTKNSF